MSTRQNLGRLFFDDKRFEAAAHDTRVWVWNRARKQVGRGEGASVLAFNRFISVPPET